MGLEENSEDKIDYSGEREKKKKYMIRAAVVVAVIVAGLLVFLVLSRSKSSSTTGQPDDQPVEEQEEEQIEEEPVIVLEPSVLTGELIDPELAKRRPLAIVVENHSASRPPTGLIEADIVYEMPVEAGITRFLTIFQQNAPTKVGPERSSRVYFLEWVVEYDAIHAHIGQDPMVFSLIRPYGVDDLRDTGAWWDSASTGRAREHRAYTSAEVLWQAASEQGWDTEYDLESWSFVEQESLLEDRPFSQRVEIDYSSSNYRSVWDYDPQRNVYLRSHADQPHIDASNNEQIWAKNVIVEYHSIWLRAGDTSGRRDMKVVGEGDVLIFSDGQVTAGKWSNASREARTQYQDLEGATINLVPGKIWVEIVPVYEDIVTYETIQTAPVEEPSV